MGEGFARGLALALFLVQAAACPVLAGEVVAIDASAPPFMYERGGRAAGIYALILQEAFQRVGVEVHIWALPWKRLLAMLDQGSLGAAGVYVNSERLARYDYSAAMYEEVLLLCVPSGSGLTAVDPPSLRGLRVGVHAGWSYGDAFDQARAKGEFLVEEVQSDGQNLLKLAARRMDAAIVNRETAEAFLAARNMGGQVRCLSSPFSVSPTHIVFSKSVGKRALLDRLDEALADMRRDGTLDHLAARAVAETPAPGLDWP